MKSHFIAEVEKKYGGKVNEAKSTINKIKQYPKVDRGHFLPDPDEDIAWAEGNLKDGRPFRIEYWIAPYVSCISYYISTLDLENATEQELKDLLIAEGLIESDDDKYLHSGFTGIILRAKKHLDASNNEIWELTILVGDEDGTYIHDHFPLSKYKFPPRNIDPYIYEPKDKNPETAEYFIAIHKEQSEQKPVPMYQGYFINNTSVPIEIMFEIPPGALSRIKPGTTVKDLTSNPAGGELISRFTNIPAHGYTGLNMRYFEWEFDFSNARHLFLQTAGVEKHVNFYMRKYLIGLKEIDCIPILNRRGYVWLPSLSDLGYELVIVRLKSATWTNYL